MSKWKAGDMAMVKIAGVDADGDARIETNEGARYDYCLPARYLHTLPPASTPEERAVVEAAVAWRSGFGNELTDLNLYGVSKLSRATSALIASRTPPDPLAELVAALDEMGVLPDRVERALSAARAAVAK